MATVSVIAKGNYFKVYGDALSQAFVSLGHEVIRFDEDTYEIPEIQADLHVVISPNCYNHETVKRLKNKKIGVLTEQMPHIGYPASPFVVDRLGQFARHKDLYELYIEWSEMNSEFLKAKFSDLNIVVFPHGFIDSDEIHVPTSQCKWDVCFLGSMSNRRRDLLEDLKKTNINVYPEHEEVWGRHKYEVMRNSAVVLNIHFADFPPSFEAHRIFDIISVGRPIVSEKMNGVPQGLLDNSLSGTMFLYDDLINGIREVLSRPPATLDAMGSSLRAAAEYRYPMENLAQLIIDNAT